MKFLKTYDKHVKKGIRNLKDTYKVTKTGLNLSNLIGDSTDATAETMHDWYMQTGMTTNQMGVLAYKVREVARDTGVTGENLANVVKQSEAMVMNFKNAGAFSTNIAGNIIAMNASAQKFGSSEFTNELQQSMTDTDAWSKSALNSFMTVSMGKGGLGMTNIIDMPSLMEDSGKMQKLIKGMK